MAKASDIRPKITLACQDCKNRNYITKKNRRNDPDRLELKKHCPTCNAHTVHKETRSPPRHRGSGGASRTRPPGMTADTALSS